MERDHGWPEGYGWSEYLDGQMVLARAKRAETILLSEIVPLKDEAEKQRALRAWDDIHCSRTLTASAAYVAAVSSRGVG